MRKIKLGELIKKIPLKQVLNFKKDKIVSGLCLDSRLMRQGNLFVCRKGINYNSVDFIPGIKKQASAILGNWRDRGRILSLSGRDIPVLLAGRVEKTLAGLWDIFYKDFCKGLKVIGITGTNGKTTTAKFIYSFLKQAGLKPALFGTVEYLLPREKIKAFLTTPDRFALAKLFCLAREQGAEYIVMEVSSHALAQRRVKDIKFSQAVFLNLTYDHLDYHKTMENYFLAKKKLFSLLLPGGLAFVNIDDGYGRRLFNCLHCVKKGFSVRGINTDFTVKAFRIYPQKTEFTLSAGNKVYGFSAPFTGRFNLYNILAALSWGFSVGFSYDFLRKSLLRLSLPKGRMEEVEKGVFVDYAHTPDALEAALSALKQAGFKKIITVFGCGGDRDKKKRPVMGKIACLNSSFCFVTNDNPRSERPQIIARDIIKGFDRDNFKLVLDRSRAIRAALVMKRNSGTAVLIAGKGHEDYQVFGKNKIHFSDQQEVLRFYNNNRE